MPEYKAILAKMAAVMEDVQYIQKDANNKFGGYNYTSERAIKEHVGAALRKHKVIFQLSQSQPFTIAGQVEDKAGKLHNPMVLYIPCEYHFWDAESGECLSGTFNGAGHVRDDKGFYAAITGAIKYILTSTFLIATGDDPETDSNSTTNDDAQPASQPQTTPKPQRSGGQQGARARTFASKYGSEDKPNYCHRCGKKHIVIGTMLYYNDNDKAVAVECPSNKDDDLPF